jgi:hypothetical protein
LAGFLSYPILQIVVRWRLPKGVAVSSEPDEMYRTALQDESFKRMKEELILGRKVLGPVTGNGERKGERVQSSLFW